jgi:hypothetical protein
MEQEIIQAEKIEKKENFFLKRIQKYQVLTFTLSFLFLFRFVVFAMTAKYNSMMKDEGRRE